MILDLILNLLVIPSTLFLLGAIWISEGRLLFGARPSLHNRYHEIRIGIVLWILGALGVIGNLVRLV